MADTGKINIDVQKEVDIQATENVTLNSASANVNITAGDTVNVQADGDINIDAADNLVISAGNITLTAADGTIILGDLEIADLEARLAALEAGINDPTRDGYSVAEISIYIRSATIPPTPAGGTYNFANQTLTGDPLSAGWTQTVPGGIYPVWMSRAVAYAAGSNGTDATLTWSTPGQVFSDGEDGISVNVIFKRSPAQPATPADTPSANPIPSGWVNVTEEIPSGADPIWASYGSRPNQNADWVWGTPIKVEGRDGATPADGTAVAEIAIYAKWPVGGIQNWTSPPQPIGGSYDFGTRPPTLVAPVYTSDQTGLYNVVLWTQDIPLGEGDIYTSRGIASAPANGVDNEIIWSVPVKTMGTGQSLDVVFLRAFSRPPTPARSLESPPNGTWESHPWVSDVAETSGDAPLWASFGKKSSESSNYWVWDRPFKVEADDRFTVSPAADVFLIACDAQGNAKAGTSAPSITIGVLRGTVDLTTDSDITYTIKTETNCDASLGSTLATRNVLTVPLNTINANNASVVVSVKFGGVTIAEIPVRMVKVLDGDNTPFALYSSAGVFKYDSTNTPFPDEQTISFEVFTGSLVGSPTVTATYYDDSVPQRTITQTFTVGQGLDGKYEFEVTDEEFESPFDIAGVTFSSGTNSSNWGATQSVRVEAALGGFTDTITIIRLTDGLAGLVGRLSNEAISFSAPSTGVVDTDDISEQGYGYFEVYQGLTDVLDKADANGLEFSVLTAEIVPAGAATVTINNTDGSPDKGKYQITAIQAGNRNISVPLQATYNGQTVRKILSISIVTDGANAINYNFSNPAHVFPTSAGSGGVYNVTDYSNSGSILRVFDGVEALDFVANPSATLSAGQFKVTTYLEAPSDSITPGAITVDSFDTTKAVVADHSDMSGTVDVAIITYNIDGKRLNGDAFQIEIVQSLAKARQGASGGLDGATVARVFAYKRATNLPTGSTAYPANDYTYEFQRNQFINVATNAVITDLDAGWSTTIPSGTEKLWVIVATAMSVTATTLVEGGSAGDWSEPVEFSRNGVNTASVPIFIRTPGELPVIEYNDPGLDPNDYSKYRFSTASFIETGNVGDAGSYALPVSTINGASVSWSATPPETGGDYLWVAWATAANSADTDLVYHGDWADNVSLLSQNGTNAVGLSITADSLVFTRRQNGTITPTYVKLNVQRQSVSDSIVWSADPNITLYPTLTSGVPSGTPIIEGQSQVSDDEVYMKSSDFLTAITNAGTNYVRVSATAGSYNDTVSIFLLEEGKNAITTVVANIVHGIPGNPNGTVNAENYLGSGTTIDVYEGSEKFAFVRATSNVPPTLQARQFTIGAPILSSVGGIRVGGVAPNNWWNAFVLGTGGTANVVDHSEFNTSLQLIVISYPITLKKSDGTVVTVNATQSIIKINQIPGADGLNNVVQFVWKRSATDLPSDDAPNTEVFYNFANKVMYVTEGQTTDALGSNGWSRVVPSGTDQLWVVAGTFSSSGETDSISPSEWSQPEKVGADGLDGFNTATVTLYKRTNTATVPAKPVSTITTGADANGMRYFFNTGSLTGLPTDWFRTPAAAGSSATGRYLWVSNATALGREESDLIVNSDWSTPQDISVNGIDGKIVRVTSSPSVFKRTSTGTVTPDYVKIEATRQGLTGSIAWTATTGVTYYSLLAGGYTPITNLATHTGSSIYIKNDSYTDLRQVISVTASVTDGSVSYSDTISVPLLADGTSAITVQVLNDNHSIPADSAGNVAAGDYVGSGTEITVYEGASQLTFISNATVSTLALGQWTIDSTYDGNAAIEPDGAIVRGAIVTGRDSFHGKINDHSAFLQTRDVATITYKVLVKARSGGVVSYFYPVQTITKTTAGETTLYGYLTNEYQPIPASSTGIVETGGYNGAGGYFKVLEGNDDVTGSCVFSVGTTTPAGITATISNDPITRGLYAVTGGMNGVSSAKVPFTATYLGRTVTKEFSVGLQRAGTPGSGFSAKVLTLNVDRNTVTYDSNGDASPSGQIIQAQAVKGGGLQASPAWEVRVFYLDGTIKSSVLNVDAVGVPSYIQGDTLYLYESDIRTVSGFNALYTKITITASEEGVNFTDFETIVKVRDGQASKNVSLSTTSHLFNVSKTGTIDPSTISLYAKDSNLAAGSTPTFAISINSTDGVDGTWVNATTNGNSSYGLISSAGSDVATIDSTKFSVDSAMVRVTWDGITDFVRISKAEEGTDALYTISTNPAHVLAADTDGNVTDVTGANTTITLYRGTAPVSEDGWAWTYSLVNFDFDSDGPGSSGDTGNVYAVYPSGRSQANSTVATIVVTGMGSGVENGYIDATVSKGTVSRTERFSLSKSKRGATGENSKSITVRSDKDTFIYDDTVIQSGQSITVDVIDQYISSPTHYVQMKRFDGTAINPQTFLTNIVVGSGSNTTTIVTTDTNFTLTGANFNTARGSTEGVLIDVYGNDVPGGANAVSDTLTITRLAKGTNAVVFTQNNGTHTVAANSSGGDILWTGSGQDITVYEGSTALTFGGATDNAEASKYYITGVASSDAGITPGNRTATTSNSIPVARVGAHSGTMTTRVATITYTIKAYRANGTSVTGTLVQSISRQDAATNGTNGLTNSVLFAYKRSSTALAADDLPSKNAGTPTSPYTYTYNFATKSWSNTTQGPITGGQFASTGWFTTIPTGTDTLYVTTATASTSSNIDEIVPADWQAPQVFSAAGVNAATVYLYQRTSSATAPTVAPVANAWRYTFATGLLEKVGTDNVWSATIPATGGDYIWITHSTAFGTAATDTDFSWAPIRLLTRRGAGVLTTILSNEAHVIPANADGSVVAGGYSGSGTRVSVLDGTDELQFVASTTTQATLADGQFTIFSTTPQSSPLPIGIGITSGGVTVSGKAAVIGNHDAMTGDSATVNIPLIIRRDGISTAITATQSLSKTRNASSFRMFPNGTVFTYNTDGGLYGNQTIEFTFNTQNLGTTTPTFTITGYVGSTATALNANLISGSGSIRTIASSAMLKAGATGTDFVKSYDRLVITGTAGTLTDTFTITRVRDGVKGDSVQGADGKDSINGTLSNESATLVSSWYGDVDSTSLSAGGGTFQVYRGTSALTGNATAPTAPNSGYTLTFAVQGTPTNCTVTINQTSGVYAVTGMSSDNAAATFRATYTQYIAGVAQTPITIDKVLSLSKSRGWISMDLNLSRLTMTFNETGAAAPANQVITAAPSFNYPGYYSRWYDASYWYNNYVSYTVKVYNTSGAVTATYAWPAASGATTIGTTSSAAIYMDSNRYNIFFKDALFASATAYVEIVAEVKFGGTVYYKDTASITRLTAVKGEPGQDGGDGDAGRNAIVFNQANKPTVGVLVGDVWYKTPTVSGQKGVYYQYTGVGTEDGFAGWMRLTGTVGVYDRITSNFGTTLIDNAAIPNAAIGSLDVQKLTGDITKIYPLRFKRGGGTEVIATAGAKDVEIIRFKLPATTHPEGHIPTIMASVSTSSTGQTFFSGSSLYKIQWADVGTGVTTLSGVTVGTVSYKKSAYTYYYFVMKGDFVEQLSQLSTVTIGGQSVAINSIPVFGSGLTIQEIIDNYESYNIPHGAVTTEGTIEYYIFEYYGINILTDSFRGSLTYVYVPDITEYNKITVGASVVRSGGSVGAPVGQPVTWNTLSAASTGFLGSDTVSMNTTLGNKIVGEKWFRIVVDNNSSVAYPATITLEEATMIIMGVR